MNPMNISILGGSFEYSIIPIFSVNFKHISQNIRKSFYGYTDSMYMCVYVQNGFHIFIFSSNFLYLLFHINY